MMIGMLFYEHKRPKRAINAFETVIRIDPSHKEAHFNLGLLYMRPYHNKKKAMHHFRRYLRLASRQDDVREVRRLMAEMERWPD